MRVTLPTLLLAFSASLAMAQTTGEPQRGNTPPGMSRDGSRPADGAIKGAPATGATIMPGEQGGLPNKDIQRCNDLNGSLREECQKKENESGAGAGGTMPSTPRQPTDILKK